MPRSLRLTAIAAWLLVSPRVDSYKRFLWYYKQRQLTPKRRTKLPESGGNGLHHRIHKTLAIR
jgi:hypothetical protein